MHYLPSHLLVSEHIHYSINIYTIIYSYFSLRAKMCKIQVTLDFNESAKIHSVHIHSCILCKSEVTIQNY